MVRENRYFTCKQEGCMSRNHRGYSGVSRTSVMSAVAAKQRRRRNGGALRTSFIEDLKVAERPGLKPCNLKLLETLLLGFCFESVYINPPTPVPVASQCSFGGNNINLSI